MARRVIVSKDGSKVAIPSSYFARRGIPLPKDSFLDGDTRFHVVDYTLGVYKDVRSAGYEIVSPIHHRYRWAGSYKPLVHQLNTAAFFTFYDRGYCHNGLGSGKTLSALWAADFLLQEGAVKRVLVVSPLSTLPDAWERTLFNHFPHIRTHLVHGAGKAALMKDPSKFSRVQIFIANHEFARSADKALFIDKTRLPVDLLIVDEGASYRALGTDKQKGMKTLAKHIPKIWWMTATPTPNAPTDAWAQADIVGTRGDISYGMFKDLTMKKVGEYRWVARPDAPAHVAKILSPSICYKTEDCIDLPGITYQTRVVGMTAEQKKIYSKMSRDAYVELSTGNVSAVNEGIKANKLVQIACGLLLQDDGDAAEVAATEKLKLLEEIMDEADTAVIVFVPYRAVVRQLAEKFKSRNPEIIMGDVPIQERRRIFDAVQNGQCRMLIANPKTMSHGVTLTASSCIVWYAPVYSNETYEQANGRIYRQGQTKHCTIVHMTSCEVEREIYYRLEHRQKMQGAVINALNKSVKNT